LLTTRLTFIILWSDVPVASPSCGLTLKRLLLQWTGDRAFDFVGWVDERKPNMIIVGWVDERKPNMIIVGWVDERKPNMIKLTAAIGLVSCLNQTYAEVITCRCQQVLVLMIAQLTISVRHSKMVGGIGRS